MSVLIELFEDVLPAWNAPHHTKQPLIERGPGMIDRKEGVVTHNEPKGMKSS